MGELASYRALVRRPGARTVFLPDTSEFEMTRREEDGRGRCFLCETNFNPIDFTIRVCRCDFGEAVEYLIPLLPR